MQRQPLLAPFLSSSTSFRSRCLRTLVFFSFFPSSMDTAPSFSTSIIATEASPAADEPGKGVEFTSSVSDAAIEGESVKEFGFERAEFGRQLLVGTVQSYDRHVFLRHKSPGFWLPNVEAPESDGLPRLLAAAIKARKNDMKYKTRLTICAVEDSDDTSDGVVLIFPEGIAYRGLTDVNVANFVESVLVKGTEWLHGSVKTLTGAYVFVCAHGSRDRRCGVCGPILIEKFKREILSRGLEGEVFVSPCSHIGGHKYAGNVIIFSQSKTGEVSGHWYGYVTPDDVPILLEQHIGKGDIIDHLWRGQMGLSEEEQRTAQNIRRQPNIGLGEDGASGCCRGNGNPRCCQNTTDAAKSNANGTDDSKEINSACNPSRRSSIFNIFSIPTRFKEPDRDTYAALAVVVAAISVAGAYCCYKHLKLFIGIGNDVGKCKTTIYGNKQFMWPFQYSEGDARQAHFRSGLPTLTIPLENTRICYCKHLALVRVPWGRNCLRRRRPWMPEAVEEALHEGEHGAAPERDDANLAYYPAGVGRKCQGFHLRSLAIAMAAKAVVMEAEMEVQ